MKQIDFLKVLIFTIVVLLIQSCDEGILPSPDNNTTDRLIWTYDFPTVMAFSLYNTVPAIDEVGNIYVLADVQSGGLLVKLSSSGTEDWTLDVGDFPLSRLIYFEGKIYYINNGSLICLNSDDGSQIWSANAPGAQEIFALNSEKVYTTNFVDIGVLGQTNLTAYDHSGNKIWETKIEYSDTDSIAFANTIAIDGNSIYVGIYTEVGNSEFAIINYIDEGNTVSKQWTWLAPEDYSVGGTSPRIKDFAIDDNGNLVFGMEDSGTEYVFSVSNQGVENWRSATSLSDVISNVAVDGDGNCYVSYDRCEKLGQDGIVWTSDVKTDWQYDGLVSKSPVISTGGSVTYENISRIVASISPDGEYSWEQFWGCELCNDEFHNITININGDIIVVGKASIYCFEGDGTGLSEKGWSKRYGNYGNTSSK
ncbi:MAG: PQQ-like beta-propeller repeat protein [Chlorobi bacterium]|nr:PQQ-like beta-propeller repeat protein [Chlorobiota bacterium]